jgi:hypothetical protein
VGFTHRRSTGGDSYFIANVSPTPRDLRVQFAVGHRAPQRWAAETDAVQTELPYEYVHEERGRRVTDVELRLDPFESCFIVFGEASAAPVVRASDPRGRWKFARDGRRLTVDGEAVAAGNYQFQMESGAPRSITVRAAPLPIAVDGAWRLTLGSRPPVRLERLESWKAIAGAADFCGWGVYEIELAIREIDPEIAWYLDLGAVHETAEASLNGRALGAAWKGARVLACGDALSAGRNRLRIEVANLWTDMVVKYGLQPGASPSADPPLRGVGTDPELAKTMGVRWGTYGEVLPKEVRPSGLLGPVRLVPTRRVRVTL